MPGVAAPGVCQTLAVPTDRTPWPSRDDDAPPPPSRRRPAWLVAGAGLVAGLLLGAGGGWVAATVAGSREVTPPALTLDATPTSLLTYARTDQQGADPATARALLEQAGLQYTKAYGAPTVVADYGSPLGARLLVTHAHEPGTVLMSDVEIARTKLVNGPVEAPGSAATRCAFTPEKPAELGSATPAALRQQLLGAAVGGWVSCWRRVDEVGVSVKVWGKVTATPAAASQQAAVELDQFVAGLR